MEGERKTGSGSRRSGARALKTGFTAAHVAFVEISCVQVRSGRHRLLWTLHTALEDVSVSPQVTRKLLVSFREKYAGDLAPDDGYTTATPSRKSRDVASEERAMRLLG